MIARKSAIASFCLAWGLTLSAFAGTDPATEQLLEETIAGEHRSDADKARDIYRNSLETLNILGLR